MFKQSDKCKNPWGSCGDCGGLGLGQGARVGIRKTS